MADFRFDECKWFAKVCGPSLLALGSHDSEIAAILADDQDALIEGGGE